MEQDREDRFVILRFDVLQDKSLSASEKLVYARICGFKKYFESKEECSAVLGVSESTVVKAKQKLCKLGHVREIGNTGRGKIYQSVYDDEPRVAKSANQSGKKAPVSLAKSANIEERESKERVKSITNVIGETPKTDDWKSKLNPEINEMFEYWENTVGYAIQGRRQANRNACNNLIKKHTADGVRKLIQGVALAQNERFAPQIADFEELQSKLSKLMAWGKKHTQKVTVY